MEWYYILGIISYGVFVVQFLLSAIFGDIDIDIDFDGNTDFDVSGLLSFKGLIHFLMGFSGWLMISGNVNIVSITIATLIGIGFMIFLFFVYKLCMKASSEPTVKTGKDLIGEKVKVYIVDTMFPNKCICLFNSSKELYCTSSTPVKVGEIKTILDFKENKYYI